MVAWAGVRRTSGAESIQFTVNPFHETASVVPGMCQPSVLGAICGGWAKALVYFTDAETAAVLAQLCICSRLVPYQLGTAGFAHALACVCLGWRIAHAELWHLLRPVLILLLVSGYMSQYIASCILPLSSGAQSPGSDLQSMLKKTALLAVSFFVCLPLDHERFQMSHFAACLFYFPVCFPGWLLMNEQARFKLLWEVTGDVLKGRHCCTSSSLHSDLELCCYRNVTLMGGWAPNDASPLPASLIPDHWLRDSVTSQRKGYSEIHSSTATLKKH